jgi:hypothetical protein
MPFGLLILIVLVALVLYLDRGASDHDNVIGGDSKKTRLT